jgi:hypothetical protein
MADDRSSPAPPRAPGRTSLATIVIWVFVVAEAIGIGVAVWYMLGGDTSP